MKRMSLLFLIALGFSLPAQAFDFGFGGKKKGGLDLNKLVKAGKAIKKAMKSTDLPPKPEYYVGRSTAAAILQQYRLYKDQAATRYVNLVGQSVARASIRPALFKAYRFAILDTDEINGLSAPGGFVFVSRGLLRCCKSEDALAAVLAHEVAHIAYKHPLMFIKEKRFEPITELVVGEAAGRMNTRNLPVLSQAFEGSMQDLTKNLIHSQYSSRTEAVADDHAIEILKTVGYDPLAFAEALEEMHAVFGTTRRGDRKGFLKTHPDPRWRIRRIEGVLGRHAVLKDRSQRQARFAKAMNGI